MIYGQENDESVITKYLDAHLEDGIKQKNLDKILDIIDDYIELKEWLVSQQENQLKFELSFQTQINGLNTSDNFV